MRSRFNFTVSLATLVLAAGLASGHLAQAQDATDAGQSAVPFAAPATPQPKQGTPVSEAKPDDETSTGSRLVRLNTDARQLRFEGEAGSRVWPVYVTDQQARGRARIRLSYTNAVSVMPEASKIQVYINDNLVAENQISAASDMGVIDADIAAGTLESGYNALRIVVHQRHRVDCSMPATYELWTQVDSASTGISFPSYAEETQTEVTELAAVPADATGATVIRAILPPDANAGQIDRMILAAQLVALRGGYGRPVVEVAEKSSAFAGISLYIGTQDELAARGFAKEATATDALMLRGGGVSGHYDMFVTGATDADVAASLDKLLAAARADIPAGSPSGVQALINQHGYRISGDMQKTFKQLGLADQEFNGRVFRTGFDLQMPSDFYPADYGKMVLKIDAGYSAGLSQGSQILVRVNDQDVSSLALPKPGGDVFRKKQLNVPLGALRPGTNHVELEAQLSNAADIKCDVQDTLDASKRFMLLEKSELQMPAIARIAHFPNLSATGLDGFPFSSNTVLTQLFLPKRDAASIGAAATFIVRAAGNGRRLMHVKTVFNRNEIHDNSAILVGAINDLPGDMVDFTGIDPVALKSSWSRAALEKASTVADLTESTDAPGAAKALAGKGESANSPAARQKAALKKQTQPKIADGDLYSQWSGEVKADAWAWTMPAFVDGGIRALKTIAQTTAATFKSSDDSYAPDNKARVVIAQHQGPNGGGKTWTLITAPNTDLLARTMRDFTAPSVWNQMDGAITTFDPKNNVVYAIQPEVDGYFIRTAPLDPSNLRLVTAGWLSNNVVFYALGFLVLALGLGITTNIVVRRSGTQH